MLIRAHPALYSLLAWPGGSSPMRQKLSLHIRPLFPVRGFQLSSSSFKFECVDSNHYQPETISKVEEFIRGKLSDALRESAGVIHQIVLITVGEDQIPCRLPWPPKTVVFQVSSCAMVQSHEVPKSSLVRYINEQVVESELWIGTLRTAGYQGTKPSVWIVQGLPLETGIELKRILTHVGSLQIKGSVLIGNINLSVGQKTKDSEKKLLEKILLGCGFRIRSAVFTTTLDGKKASILFAAEQLCLSDDQVASARREMELAEESGDEENFEDWI